MLAGGLEWQWSKMQVTTTVKHRMRIFGKFSQFWSGKCILQEVLDMPKAKQDLGLFLGVMILTNIKFQLLEF